MTKAGQRFTQPTNTATNNFFEIKEWKASFTESDPAVGYYYKLSDYQTEGPDSDITLYSTKADAIVGPSGTSCKGEYIAYLIRLPANDPKWNDPNSVSPLFGSKITIGNYTFAYTTKKEYGPGCFNNGPADNYVPDDATSTKFGDVVNTFITDFKSLEAE